MKILFVDGFIHPKNKIGFDLMCKSKGYTYTTSSDREDFFQEWDFVFIPTGEYNPFFFQNSKCIMYGPHNFIFTNSIWKKHNAAFPPNCFYNLLSPWITQVQEEFGGMSMAVEHIPFAVDVDKFSPTSKKQYTYDCFVYKKARDNKDLEYVESVLREKGLNYKVIKYGSYTEEEYLDILNSSRFGIWIGCHESQGFALQEALSCNVPLLVWNVTSMFQEYNINNEICYTNEIGLYKLKATSTPYWDDRCGIRFESEGEFANSLDSMLNTMDKFKPRSYILDTLSPEVCMNRLLSVIKKRSA
jgi:hypothetical protein